MSAFKPFGGERCLVSGGLTADSMQSSPSTRSSLQFGGSTSNRTSSFERCSMCATVSKLRAHYAPYTPSPRLLGDVDMLQQRRAQYMIEWLRPILWQSPEGEYHPVGYVYDTARL